MENSELYTDDDEDCEVEFAENLLNHTCNSCL
jgi:hypothetical protein